MAELTIVILPAKKLADNHHRIRIRVSHNNETGVPNFYWTNS